MSEIMSVEFWIIDNIFDKKSIRAKYTYAF